MRGGPSGRPEDQLEHLVQSEALAVDLPLEIFEDEFASHDIYLP